MGRCTPHGARIPPAPISSQVNTHRECWKWRTYVEPTIKVFAQNCVKDCLRMILWQIWSHFFFTGFHLRSSVKCYTVLQIAIQYRYQKLVNDNLRGLALLPKIIDNYKLSSIFASIAPQEGLCPLEFSLKYYPKIDIHLRPLLHELHFCK